MAAFKCHIKGGTIGHAFLDDNTGKYVTVTTASAFFGLPEVVKMVAKRNALETDPLIEPVDGECGKFEHESLSKVLVWGNPDGVGSICKMVQEEPRPQVDVFESASDVEVITGIQIDANGDLELVKSSIKACSSSADNGTLALSQTDVVTDLYCDANGLTKSYKTIKYLGSEVSSGGPVSLPCTNPNNYDWEYIFNNHVYNEAWWNVDYYDITFPEGCEPCPEPTGCCTATAYPTGQDGITQAACEAETGYVSWTEGECDGGGDCENTVVSGFNIGGFATSGCSATFTQTGTATISGGTATINGDWAGLAMGFPVGSVSGTFTFTTDGTNHSASGTLPANWGGGTVSVSDTGTCGGTYQGNAALSGGGSPCGGMINGTYDFTLT